MDANQLRVVEDVFAGLFAPVHVATPLYVECSVVDSKVERLKEQAQHELGLVQQPARKRAALNPRRLAAHVRQDERRECRLGGHEGHVAPAALVPALARPHVPRPIQRRLLGAAHEVAGP